MEKQKSESKKLLPLYLKQLFLEKTDETHYVEMKDILEYLETKGIYADRRTVYSAIHLLDETGFKVEHISGRGIYKYHYHDRLFDLKELKFLIDAVSASKFLTEKKSKELINKIKSLGSKYDGMKLNRNILIGNRIKSMKDKIFDNLDILYTAIAENSQIGFKYLKWNTKKELEYRKDGQLFIVSPYAVSLQDDNYYLIAFDNISHELRHYRIDKMDKIKITNEPREGKELFKSFNILDYSKKSFGMFSGREETVGIECAASLLGVFIERFGEDVSVRPSFEKTNHFVVRAAVHISPQFYGWIFGLGKDVRIVSPESVKKEFQKTVEDILSNYNP